ncbi:dual oxidase 1-like [Sycon ciliatum]|uniref:dual oxidase 1-like n=1 Tax=Sycon ciliatum TaxID=27933 RepID=UPI0031F618C4
MQPTSIILLGLCAVGAQAFLASNITENVEPNGTYHLPEVEGYDGWYNNLAHPEWGGADMPLSRRLTPVFADGTYQPSGAGRPNPLDIAEATMRGAVGQTSYRNRTALLTFFGQQVVEEILDAQRPGCPPEYFNIAIPKGHRLYDSDGDGGKYIPFLRSRYDKNTGQSPNNVRQQLNEITPWIDGGLTYGITKAWADALRSFHRGQLKCLGNQTWDCALPDRNDIGLPIVNPPPPADHELKSARRFFRIGNPRGNENPMLLSMQVVWFRNHNYITNRLLNVFEGLGVEVNDEILYNRARQWNIAEYQHIVLDEWLPAFLGQDIPSYPGYSSTTFPGITHIFQSAAMRFGHTIVPPIAYRALVREELGVPTCMFRPLGGEPSASPANTVTSVRTCQSYFNSPDIINVEEGVDELLFGLSRQVTEREDNIITEDLQGFVFGGLDFSRRDLMALNIQRARDHGLPDYNTARMSFGLPRVNSYREINPTIFDNFEEADNTYSTTRDAIRRLESLHNNFTNQPSNVSIDTVDIWPGGLLETVDGPGPLFSTVILDQFLRIREGDRFWFENEQNGLFNQEQIATIRAVSFKDVLVRIMRASWFNSSMLTRNPFRYDGQEDEDFPLFRTHGCEPHIEYNVPNLAQHMEPCSPMKTFDYFQGSEGPFIGSFVSLGLYLLLNVVILFVAVRVVKQRAIKARASNASDGGADVWLKAGVISTSGGVPMVADELKVNPARKVVVAPSVSKKQLKVYDAVSGAVVRSIDLAHIKHCDMLLTPQNKVLTDGVILLRFANLYDLVLRFAGSPEPFSNAMNDFLNHIGVTTSRRYLAENAILADVFTKEDRQKLVEEFFRILFRESLAEEGQPREKTNFIGIRRRTTKRRKQILSLELTKAEFAEAMSMKPDTLFVEQVFKLVDDDHSGTVSFQEFLKFLILFTKGTADNKLELMFNIYDIDGSGTLEREEFTEMLGHLIEQANEQVDSGNLKTVVDSMMASAGLADQRTIDIHQFKRLFGEYRSELDDAAVQVRGKTARKSNAQALSVGQLQALDSIKGGNGASSEPSQLEEEAPAPQAGRYCSVRRRKIDVATAAYENEQDNSASSDLHIEPLPVEAEIGDNAQLSTQADNILRIQRFWENYRLHIFWFTLYQLVVGAIFVERAYYYSVEREHVGLRRIAGYGVTVTRGAASAMMFTYSSLLVTMSRNIITRLRETFLNKFIPFDFAHTMHKLIAYTALIYTIVHCIGHAINFYHISTQTANDLTCLFREYYHLSDELPKFQFWLFNTLTGVTGYLLVLVCVTLYIFAMPYARRYLFRTFWITHHLYIVMYILLILHGSGRLVQPPLFQWFFIVPASVFAIDKLISYSRKKVEIVVYKAEKLPSGVTHLQFKKPSNFDYLSGQWVRIACLSLNESEYHPFTLTSAPGEPTLDLHIRAVGPWTQNLRTVYDPENPKNRDAHGALSFPRLYLDGPFGEGHQDWFKYEIAVLVGGGIGVTPFASILKDVVHKQANNTRFAAKKVYFLWVTRTQKQFEWMTDIIRQVEEQDKKQLTDIHIFITQFYQKFDLRTIMLYICERHFQKVSNRSLFSGLRSVTHFGRPQFNSFFEGLQDLHNSVGQIGVFSCGPPPMTRSVEEGCQHCNQIEGPIFIHHSENF